MSSFVCIPFVYGKFGIYLARTERGQLKNAGALIIEILGDKDEDTLRRLFARAKIGRASQIRQLVNQNLLGYRLEFLQAPPEGIAPTQGSLFCCITDEGTGGPLQDEEALAVHWPGEDWTPKLQLWISLGLDQSRSLPAS